MNTFVVKSFLHLAGGHFIGTTNDGQYLYSYRSHKVFKDANPDAKEFTIIEDLDRKEFDFRKYNVCPRCAGLKAWYRVSCDKPMNGKVMYDEDGFVLFDEEISVYCTCDDGTYIGHLESEIQGEKRQTEQFQRDYVELRDYIRRTSKCKTCHGEQGHTLGLCTCSECGLPGNCPWPG
jgi:hypothetical protein